MEVALCLVTFLTMVCEPLLLEGQILHERWSPVYTQKKGMVEGATSITAAAFHPKIEFHFMLQEQTKPVLRCLKDNCCETGS